MFRAEIKEGSGLKALITKVISQETYDTIIDAWDNNLQYLKDHVPTLIHFSTFPWTIYAQKRKNWSIVAFTALADVLWWDPLVQIAQIKFPPYMNLPNALWRAFKEGYSNHIEEKRLNLYSLLVVLSSASGTYLAPDYVFNKEFYRDVEAKLQTILESVK